MSYTISKDLLISIVYVRKNKIKSLCLALQFLLMTNNKMISRNSNKSFLFF